MWASYRICCCSSNLSQVQYSTVSEASLLPPDPQALLVVGTEELKRLVDLHLLPPVLTNVEFWGGGVGEQTVSHLCVSATVAPPTAPTRHPTSGGNSDPVQVAG